MTRPPSPKATTSDWIDDSEPDGVSPAADAADSGDEVSDRICATIVSAIADGALLPGTKLPEDVIATHFGVSRTVVRGALAVLQREHLLERRRNRGTFVAEPGVSEARQLFDMRRALERAVIDRVMPLATKEDLDRLDELSRHEELVHEGADESAKSRLAGRFHIELARLTGNEVLVEMLEKVVVRLAIVSMRFESRPADGCGAEDHRRIVAAIRAGDAAGAWRELDQHLVEMEQRVRLDPVRGESRSFQSVLERFSGGR